MRRRKRSRLTLPGSVAESLGVVLFALTVALSVTMGCVRHEKPSANIEALSEDPEPEAEPQPDWLPVHVGGRLGFIDDAGKLVFMTEFSEYEAIGFGVPDWTDGFLWVGSNFIDRAGRTLSKVPLDRFDFMVAPWFEDGMAYVSFLEAGKWRYGLIDSAGRIVFGADDYFRPERIRDNRCPVPFGERWGYIETNGVVAIPGRYESARNFQRGLAWVQKQEKWGVIDLVGRFVIPPRYDDVEYSGFQKGVAWVKRGRHWGLIDTSGKWRIEPRFESVEWVSDGLAGITHRGRAGVVDLDGNFVVPAKFDEIRPREESESLWVASLGGSFGLVSSNGTIRLPFEYDDIWRFWDSRGVYRITQEGLRGSKEAREGVVDRTGAMVLEPVYEWLGSDFSEGLLGFRRDGKHGLLDQDFRVAIEPRFGREHDLTWGVQCGRARFRAENRKCGYLDTQGREVIPPIYDDAAYQFMHGLAYVAVDENDDDRMYGIIDTNGVVVVPLQYTEAEVVKPGIVRLHQGSRYGYFKLPDNIWIWEPTE